MTQPTKKGNIDTQIDKIMVLLDQMQKAAILNASVKFRNILKSVYEGEVSKLENMVFKTEIKELNEVKQ